MQGTPVRSLFLVYLVVASQFHGLDAVQLRSSPKKVPKDYTEPLDGFGSGGKPTKKSGDVEYTPEDLVEPLDPFGYGRREFYFRVENTEVFNRTKTEECVCREGTFWHWKSKQCVKQGGWGYECGFFPTDVRHRVCKDGFTCETKEELAHQATGHDATATCRHCRDGDICPTGMERHQAECAKMVVLKGQTCSTVVINVGNETLEDSSAVSATYTATADATSTQTRTITADVTREEKASASASASATAKSTQEVTVKKTAEATAEASAEATKTASGSKGGIDVEMTKSASASVEHTESASAERSAKADATATSEGSATVTATGKASASAQGKGSATASTTAKSVKTVTIGAETLVDGTIRLTECITVDEAFKLVDLYPGKRIGSVLAAKVIAAAKEKAFFVASMKARQLMKKHEALKAAADKSKFEEAGDKAFADAEDVERSKLEDDAINSEAQAGVEEAGSDKESKRAALERAEDMAKDVAERSAKKAAESKAKADAAAQASAQARSRAEEAAGAAAAKEAGAEAKAKAGKAAQAAAKADAEANAQADAAEAAQNEAEKDATEAAQAAAEAEAAQKANEGAQQKAKEAAEAAAEAKAEEAAEAAAEQAAEDVADLASPDMPGQGDAQNVIPREDNAPKIADRRNYNEEDMENLNP